MGKDSHLRLRTCCTGLKAVQGADNAFEDAASLLQRNSSLHNSASILLGGREGGCEHTHNETKLVGVKYQPVPFICTVYL